jgi:hypothetical protein
VTGSYNLEKAGNAIECGLDLATRCG